MLEMMTSSRWAGDSNRCDGCEADELPLRGIPHTLLVLSDVSAALREEERLAWERLIRVLGHEINNSLTPIKSIAGSLRGRLAAMNDVSGEKVDFERGLEVIENRSGR